jgi:hypothetical protein
MSHTEYSAQFVQYSSVFLGLEEALLASPPRSPLCVNRRGVWERRNIFYATINMAVQNSITGIWYSYAVGHPVSPCRGFLRKLPDEALRRWRKP